MNMNVQYDIRAVGKGDYHVPRAQQKIERTNAFKFNAHEVTSPPQRPRMSIKIAKERTPIDVTSATLATLQAADVGAPPASLRISKAFDVAALDLAALTATARLCAAFVGVDTLLCSSVAAETALREVLLDGSRLHALPPWMSAVPLASLSLARSSRLASLAHLPLSLQHLDVRQCRLVANCASPAELLRPLAALQRLETLSLVRSVLRFCFSILSYSQHSFCFSISSYSQHFFGRLSIPSYS